MKILGKDSTHFTIFVKYLSKTSSLGAMDVDVDGIKRETTSLSEVEESSKRGDNNRDSDSSDSDILIDEDKTKGKKKSSIKIKLQHIPVFCYIGLVLCKEPVLLSDLIRFVICFCFLVMLKLDFIAN